MSHDYKKAESFVWFGPAPLAEWKEYLDNGADRAEFHRHGDQVFASFFKDGQHLGTENESHICPIDCP